MRTAWVRLILAGTVACTGTPTGGGEPELTPAGTILAGSPNDPENGTYLIDVVTGAVTRIADRGDPLSVAFQGGYSTSGGFVYGRRSQPAPRNFMKVEVASGSASTLLEVPDPDMLVGAYDLSADGGRLVLQTQDAQTGGIRVSTVDLATRTWTQISDAVGRLDTIPLGSIKWSLDGKNLYAVTEVYPDRSELIKINVATSRFEIISPTTRDRAPLWLDISPDDQVLAHGDGTFKITFRDRDGTPLQGYPEIQPGVSRPTFSPDGKFLAVQTFSATGEDDIVLMRLSDGKRWPLKIEGDLTLWLSDWF